jgi:hypothetical protein
MISLERGSLSGLSESDPPMRWIYVIRRQIPSEFKNEEQVQVWLSLEAKKEFKGNINHLHNDSIIFNYSSYKDKYYYYSSAYRTPYYTESDPEIQSFNGYGISQFAIYLPKYYREWEVGYLLLFVSYPYPSFSSDYQISVDKPNYLFEVLNEFKCVEDLKDKKQEIKWSERWY